MKKILFVLFALLLTSATFADDHKSHWLVGGDINFSVVEVNPNTTGNRVYFYGNGDFLVRGGYEFRLLNWLSVSPAIGVERNGWSWDHSGSEGSISYLYPFVEGRVNFHVMGAHLSLGGSYGIPLFVWGDLDGKNTTGDLGLSLYGMSFFYDVGYTIKDHHRVGLGQKIFYAEQECDMYATPTQFFVYTIGVSYSYLF